MNSKNRRHFDQLGSFKVIKNGAIRQITYDFHIKHMPTLCRFGDVKKIVWIYSQEKLIVMATSLGDRKNNFRSFIANHSSTNPANLVKIVPVDVKIIGLSLKIS